MDSLSPSLRKKHSDIIVQIDEQEHNDQTKAFRWALENVEDISQIYILGATGEREDHTIGNISLLMEYARTYDLESRGINVEMVSDHATIFAVTDTCEMDCGEGRRISIFSPDNSLRIKSEGLEWPTDEVVFDNWWKATLNRASQDHVKLKFSHRSIALIMMD
jgi:thiamine pyrophosphokinase